LTGGIPQALVKGGPADDYAEGRSMFGGPLGGHHAKAPHRDERHTDRDAESIKCVQTPRTHRACTRLLAWMHSLLEHDDAQGTKAFTAHKVERGA
jgi:hypothetical protein